MRMPYQAVIIQQLRTLRFDIHVAPLTRGGLRLERVLVYLRAALGIALAFAMPAPSQTNQAPARTGTIYGYCHRCQRGCDPGRDGQNALLSCFCLIRRGVAFTIVG